MSRMKRRRIEGAGTSRKFGGEGEETVVPEVRFKKGHGKVKKGSFEHRFERRRYLNQLAEEFDLSPEMECKQQVMANLANFAYDPYNYHFFGEIGVIPRFLAELTVNRNEKLTEFAMAGLCNCSGDRRIQKEILRKDGVDIVKRHVYLKDSSVSTLISAVTTLINLMACSEDNRLSVKNGILLQDFKSRLMFLLTNYQDNRVKNVVQVLLEELNS